MSNHKKNRKLDALYDPLSTGIENGNVQKQTTSLALVLSAFGASLLTVGNGANYAWSSPVTLKLKSNETSINPLGQPSTNFQIAFVIGLLPFGALLSPMFIRKFCDAIGRKSTMIMLSTVMLLTEITLSFSTTINMYYISRFVIGLCTGGAYIATSMFLSEISEDHNRGMIGCFLGLSAPLGSLYAYIIGSFCSVKSFTLLCGVPNIVNILCFLIHIPETPFYLASKGDKEKTLRALQKIRNKSSIAIEMEYQTIENILKETSDGAEGTWGSLFAVKSLRKGLIITIPLMLLVPLSGIVIILYYAGSVFNISGNAISGDMTGIIVGSMKFVGALSGTLIIERLGRRPLLIISSLGTCLSNLSLGSFFYLKDGNFNVVEYLEWLPVVSVIFFIISYSLGIGIIPYALMSELFPTNIKSKTSSLCCSLSQTVVFLMATLFPIMSDLIGKSWCIWFASVCGFLGFLFVFCVFPEIKGKGPIEIQTLLSK